MLKHKGDSGFYVNKICFERSSSTTFLYYFSCCAAFWGLLYIGVDWLLDQPSHLFTRLALLVYCVFMLIFALLASYVFLKALFNLMVNKDYTFRKKYLCVDNQGIFFPLNNHSKTGGWVLVEWNNVLSIKEQNKSNGDFETVVFIISVVIPNDEYKLVRDNIKYTFIEELNYGAVHIDILYENLPEVVWDEIKRNFYLYSLRGIPQIL